MKGIWIEQYDPTDKPLRLRSREEFLNKVRSTHRNRTSMQRKQFVA
jgi:hypothetical protein